MLHHVVIVRTNVSGELSASFIMKTPFFIVTAVKTSTFSYNLHIIFLGRELKAWPEHKTDKLHRQMYEQTV
jgi:hypothetical protein